MKEKYLPIIALFLISVIYLQAEDNASTLGLYLQPGVVIPLGEPASYLSLGGTLNVSGEYKIPRLPILYITGKIGYNFNPIRNAINSVQSFSIFSAQLGAGVHFEIFPWLRLKSYASGGYYYGFLNDTSPFIGGGNPIFEIGASSEFLITDWLSVQLGTSFVSYLDFFNSIDILFGISLRIPNLKSVFKKRTVTVKPPTSQMEQEIESLEISDIQFEPVFPVFHKYYDDHAVGTAVVSNPADVPITDIRVSLFVKDYMNAPKECCNLAELKPRESREIGLFALFSDRVLEITEGTKLAAEIIVSYTQNDVKHMMSKVETIRLYDRNAMTWDDDRKAAAFVTAKDPAVLTFAKNVLGIVKDQGKYKVNYNFLAAIAFHEALALSGMTYVLDPKTPYTEFSKRKHEVDFLQFPRQTLEYRAGDCDDLSILFCAMLESVGVETAFITIPGHIFIAFSVDMNPDVAVKEFTRADELIFQEDKTWIPVEVTEIKGGFLKAWERGAKEWREQDARNQASLHPVHECWKLYEPVGLSFVGSGISALPLRSNIITAYTEEVERFIEREIYPKVIRVQADMKKNGQTPKLVNQLGVLYARYGLIDRAEVEFTKILRQQEYIPALVNLGNIHYLNGNMKKALDFYERAYQKDSMNPRVLLCLARLHHELENYGLTKEAYNKLKDIDPELAFQFSYLDLKGEEAIRAAEITQMRGVVLWEEE